MSAVRDSFHASILGKRYTEAVITLNGLNMEEMLPALAAIGEKHRQEVIKALFATLGQVFTSRIQYALEVVRDLQLSSFAPGDLQQAGQVDDAKAFIAVPAVPPRMLSTADAIAMSVIAAINPTSIAQNREFSGLIFQQATCSALPRLQEVLMRRRQRRRSVSRRGRLASPRITLTARASNGSAAARPPSHSVLRTV
jgi:hypothetical protein